MVLSVGIMAKVLSLMATYTGDESQYFRSVEEMDDQLSNIEENKEYTGTPYRRRLHAGMSYVKCVHTRRSPVHEVRTPVHLLQGREKHTRGFLMFNPWNLAENIVLLWFWLVVLIHDLRKILPI